MKVIKKYVVYQLKMVMGSKDHLALEEVSFKGMTFNGFDTEEEAIQALIDDERTYNDYVILKQVFIC